MPDTFFRSPQATETKQRNREHINSSHQTDHIQHFTVDTRYLYSTHLTTIKQQCPLHLVTILKETATTLPAAPTQALAAATIVNIMICLVLNLTHIHIF